MGSHMKMTNIAIRNSTRLLTLTLVGLTAAFIAVQEQQKTKPDLDDQQRQLNVQSFDYIWTTVRDQYFDPQLGGVDWEAARDQLRPKVEMATTSQKARGVMNELLDKLKVSHFGIIPADAYQKLDADRPLGSYETGMDVRIVDDQVIVTEVLPGSPSDQLGVKTGWQVVRVGQTDMVQRFDEISKELEDHPHRRTILVDAAKGKLLGKSGESIEVAFRNENDHGIELTIPLIEPRGKKSQFGHIPEFHVWIDVKKLDGNIGYIRFNAFMDPAYLMPQFNKAMTDFMDADGIIIDVRGNGGGLGEMATSMMGWRLKDGKQQMGTVILRETELKMLVRPRAINYKGPVVVLIDESSVSAAEFFASGMKDLQLAHLIGTRTAGAALGSMVEKLPNGDGFQYARANYISMKTGKSLEGVGVPPDQEIEHRRNALVKGLDLQLEAAVQWIHDQNVKDKSS